MTDGHSNGNVEPIIPATKLRAAGVSIFCIGVGDSISQTELREISSDPDEDYVFTLSNFNELASFVDRVSSVSCGGKEYYMYLLMSDFVRKLLPKRRKTFIWSYRRGFCQITNIT